MHRAVKTSNALDVLILREVKMFQLMSKSRYRESVLLVSSFSIPATGFRATLLLLLLADRTATQSRSDAVHCGSQVGVRG